MDKKWKKLPLAAAISAIVAAPVWADTNELSVKAESTQISADNYIDVKYGEIGEVPNNTNVLNNSVIGDYSFYNSEGVIHASSAAGFYNQGSNQVAIGVDQNEEEGVASTVTVASTVFQGSDGDNISSSLDGAGAGDNTASISGNAFSGAKGIVGSNSTSGIANLQTNSVALANAEFASGLDMDATSTQKVGGLDRNNEADAEGNTITNAGVDNVATIDSSLSGVTGVTGINVSSGSANQQSNSVSLANYKDLNSNDPSSLGNQTYNDSPAILGNSGNIKTSKTATVTISATGNQSISDNQVIVDDSVPGIQENTANISSSFSAATGIVGMNVSAGEANAQSNNVALAHLDANGNIAVKVDATSEQSITSNSVSHKISTSPTADNVNNNIASVTSSFSGSTTGIVGVNTSAGQTNAQTNNISIAAKKGNINDMEVTTTALAKSLQTASDSYVTQVNSVNGSSKQHAVVNTASIDSSFNNVSGNAGVNVASGQSNMQANNMVLTNRSISVSGNDTPTAGTIDIDELDGTIALNDQKIVGGEIGAGANEESENIAGIDKSFHGTTGVVGVNVTAGQSNLQSNNVAITKGEPTDVNDTTVTAAVSRQQIDNVDVTLADGFENGAGLTSSFNSGTNGIIGVNVSAGQANVQSNNASISTSGAGGNSFALAGNAQVIGAELNSDGTITGAANSMNVIQSTFESNGSITNSFDGAKGIMGVNVAAGQLNAQANNVAVAVSSATDATTGAHNVQTSLINEVQYSAEGTYTATIGPGAFVGAKGVIGSNVAVGVANGQSNNVAIQVNEAYVNGPVTAASAQGNFANGKQGVSVGNVDLAEFGPVVANAQLSAFSVADDSADDFSSTIQTVGNTSSISGNAFQNAKGIIGVNVATGMGNLQSNNVTLIASNN